MRDHGNIFTQNTHLVHQHQSESKTKDWDSVGNFDSLYYSDSDQKNDPNTESDMSVNGTIEDSGCTTPYKNIDVLMTYSKTINPVDSLYSECTHSHKDDNSDKTRTSKDLPPVPTYFLYHPKNCPLHRGAPPRLSPIGALSPPHRSGAPPPGAVGYCLSSPLFPRSHTLPALAAPFYYPNLYPPIPPRPPPLPPKLYQAPLQSRAASKISLSPFIIQYTLSLCLTSCLHECASVFFSFCPNVLFLCGGSSTFVFSFFNSGICRVERSV